MNAFIYHVGEIVVFGTLMIAYGFVAFFIGEWVGGYIERWLDKHYSPYHRFSKIEFSASIIMFLPLIFFIVPAVIWYCVIKANQFKKSSERLSEAIQEMRLDEMREKENEYLKTTLFKKR